MIDTKDFTVFFKIEIRINLWWLYQLGVVLEFLNDEEKFVDEGLFLFLCDRIEVDVVVALTEGFEEFVHLFQQLVIRYRSGKWR